MKSELAVGQVISTAAMAIAENAIAQYDARDAECDRLRKENARLFELLKGVTSILEAVRYSQQLGKTQMARLNAAKAAIAQEESTNGAS